jgi:hypothetical protein
MKSLLDATSTLLTIRNSKDQTTLLPSLDSRDNSERTHQALLSLSQPFLLLMTTNRTKAMLIEAFQIIIKEMKITHLIRKIIIMVETLLNTEKTKWETRKALMQGQLTFKQVHHLEKLEKSNTWILLAPLNLEIDHQVLTLKLNREIDLQVVHNGCLHMLNKRKEKWVLQKIKTNTDKTMWEIFLTISKT